MIEIVPSNQRYHFETDWLSAYWHFSFDHYYDPKNVSFGPLRVFNDDVVQPGGGFPTHPHREMEILTVPIEGRLEHSDSKGNRGVVGPNEVQRMSAGTGISHSEFNASSEEPAHLLQIWIVPAVRGLEPSWEQKSFPREARLGRFLPVASGEEALAKKNNLLLVHQDATLYLATIRPEDKVEYPLRPERRAYLFVIAGETRVHERVLRSGDVAKISDEKQLSFKAEKPSDLLLIDLP